MLTNQFDMAAFTPMLRAAMVWHINNNHEELLDGSVAGVMWPIDDEELDWFEAPVEYAETAFKAALARGCEPNDALEFAEEAFDSYFEEEAEEDEVEAEDPQ